MLTPQETYFTLSGSNDMFWNRAMNQSAIDTHCQAKYGLVPRPRWIGDEFHGHAGASRIVFSNGGLDPWSSGGVINGTPPSETETGVTTVLIPNGAHHLDLFFSNPADPPDVIAARKLELEMIAKWIK